MSGILVLLAGFVLWVLTRWAITAFFWPGARERWWARQAVLYERDGERLKTAAKPPEPPPDGQRAILLLTNPLPDAPRPDWMTRRGWR